VHWVACSLIKDGMCTPTVTFCAFGDSVIVAYMAALAAGSLRLPTRRCAVSTRRAPVCVARSSSAHAAPAAVPQLAKASLAAGAVAAAQALSAVPALAAVRLVRPALLSRGFPD